MCTLNERLLGACESAYLKLLECDWPGRCSHEGQALLCDLRNAIANATGRTEQDVQDTMEATALRGGVAHSQTATRRKERWAMSTKVPARRQLRPLARIGVGEKVMWTDANGTAIQLSVADVRQLLPHGKYPATDGEILLFLHQARSMGANPFLRDLHLVKYSPTDPAACITGYHFLMATAGGNDSYRGFEQWFVGRDGKRILDGLAEEANVVAAICEVSMQGYDHPIKFVARMAEFNKGQAQWKVMPVVMLGKCAIANAHRLADPGLAGMYLPEEVGQGYADADVIDAEVVVSPVAEGQPAPAAPDDTVLPDASTPASAAPDAPLGVCPTHNVAFVRRQGTYKTGDKKGESYDFIACPEKVGSGWCKEKPVEANAKAAKPSPDKAGAPITEDQFDAIAKLGERLNFSATEIGVWMESFVGASDPHNLTYAQATEVIRELQAMKPKPNTGEGAE